MLDNRIRVQLLRLRSTRTEMLSRVLSEQERCRRAGRFCERIKAAGGDYGFVSVSQICSHFPCY